MWSFVCKGWIEARCIGCEAWRLVHKSRYLRIIFLKGAADVHTKSGAVAATEQAKKVGQVVFLVRGTKRRLFKQKVFKPWFE